MWGNRFFRVFKKRSILKTDNIIVMWLYFYYTIHKQEIISTQSCKINRKGDKICYSLGCIRCYTSKFVRKVGEHPVSTLYNLDPYGYCVFTLEIGCLNCSSGQTSLTIRSWKLYELYKAFESVDKDIIARFHCPQFIFMNWKQRIVKCWSLILFPHENVV